MLYGFPFCFRESISQVTSVTRAGAANVAAFREGPHQSVMITVPQSQLERVLNPRVTNAKASLTRLGVGSCQCGTSGRTSNIYIIEKSLSAILICMMVQLEPSLLLTLKHLAPSGVVLSAETMVKCSMQRFKANLYLDTFMVAPWHVCSLAGGNRPLPVHQAK
jgi:hypothetical protein